MAFRRPSEKPLAAGRAGWESMRLRNASTRSPSVRLDGMKDAFSCLNKARHFWTPAVEIEAAHNLGFQREGLTLLQR